MAPLRFASRQSMTGDEQLEARSRQEIFRHMCAVVFDLAPRWGDRGAEIVVTGSLLTRAAVQSVFDEISEKYHVGGIGLRFDQRDGRLLRVIFEPIDRTAPRHSRRNQLSHSAP
jgi:hypothetical protein